MTDPASNRLPDGDVRAAMRAMSGYIDITTGDFREIYELSHDRAIRRLFEKMEVSHLMRHDFSALKLNQSLTEAAEQMALMHAHTLPVVDAHHHLVCMVMRRDFLERFHWDQWL